ncbi:MAG: hypothetical protein KGL50_09955, partial [Burkholderiales bacterium]|nr:hypothetical protein [Burkholderiales bacterium]
AGRAADAGDASAWATAREIALRQRIDRDRALVAQLEAGSTSADPGAAERLRRVSGALLWQQAVDRPARQWQVRKGLGQAQAALARAQAGDAALTRAQQQEPLRNQGFQARIQALGLRVAALQPQLAALAGEQQSALQDLAVAGLQGQQQRLDVYAAQARLAIAQILDRARLERRDPPPPAGVGATTDPLSPAQAPR